MLVKFTGIFGEDVYINAQHVEAVLVRASGGGTLILPVAQPDVNMHYTVREPLEKVVEIINKALMAERECKHVYEAVSTSTGGASYARCSKCGWVPSHNRWE